MTDFFYRADNGNDGNDGLTFATAFKTLAFAITNSIGVGNELRCVAETPETLAGQYTIAGSGAAASRYRIVGASAVDGSVDGSVCTLIGNTLVLFRVTGSFVTIDKLLLDVGAGTRGINVAGGGGLAIRDCEVKDGSQAGVVVGNTAVIITGCNIHGFTQYGAWFQSSGGSMMSGNRIHDNILDGVLVETLHCKFVRNEIFANGRDGIRATDGSSHVTHCDGNTVDGNAGHGIAFGSATQYVAVNNALTENGGYGLSTGGTAAVTTADYNLTHNNTSGATDMGADFGDNNITGAPLFTNTTPGSEDFTPLSGSPLISAGINSVTIGAKEPSAAAPTFASVDDVRLNVDRGDGQLGTVRAADVDDQRLGVVFDANDSLTGTVRLPSINDVRLSTVFDSLDSLTGNVRLPTNAQVVDGVVYDSLDSETGSFTCPTPPSSGTVGRKLKQNAVYWEPDTLDDYGQLSFLTGVEKDVRWQDVQQLFVDANGDERTSRAIAYYDSTSDDLRINGRLYLGTLASLSGAEQADPTLVDNAWVIQQLQDSPSLRAGETLGKVFM